MSGWQVALVVMGVMFLDIVVVFGLVVPAIVRGSWGTLADRFPEVAPAVGAVRREFQSFKFGMLNLGCCVHVEVDERFLHLRPAWLARRMSCRAMSVPWHEVRLQGPARLGVRRAMIRKTLIAGPAWCLDLAEGAAESAGGPGNGVAPGGVRPDA